LWRLRAECGWLHPHVVIYRRWGNRRHFLAHSHATFRENSARRAGPCDAAITALVVGGGRLRLRQGRVDGGVQLQDRASGVTILEEDDVEIQFADPRLGDRARWGEKRGIKRGAKIRKAWLAGWGPRLHGGKRTNIICAQTGGLAGSTVFGGAMWCWPEQVGVERPPGRTRRRPGSIGSGGLAVMWRKEARIFRLSRFAAKTRGLRRDQRLTDGCRNCSHVRKLKEKKGR